MKERKKERKKEMTRKKERKKDVKKERKKERKKEKSKKKEKKQKERKRGLYHKRIWQTGIKRDNGQSWWVSDPLGTVLVTEVWPYR